MPSRTKYRKMTEEEYLREEEKATVRHEYVDGHVFAMSGSTQAHSLICGNLLAYLHGHLRGSSCRVYANDLKVRIQSVRSYYYPDLMVNCQPFDAKSVFTDGPVLLIEILSPSTKQIDRREKLAAYQKIQNLKEYAIVYQDRQQIELYRRIEDDDWEIMVLNGRELVLESIPGGAMKIPFNIIYEGYSPRVPPRRVKEDSADYIVDQEEDDDEIN